jgi:hypothetical protein
MANAIFSWVNPKLETLDTGQCGKGLFTRAPVRKHELLVVFGGYVMTRKDEEHLPEDYNDTGIQISPDLVMTVREPAELSASDYINHRCAPNAGIKGQICLVAMKKIGAGVEITFDYGMVLYRGKGVRPYRIVCACGARNCRGVITDNDWKINELQQRYHGYFSWHLQEKINRLRGLPTGTNHG